MVNEARASAKFAGSGGVYLVSPRANDAFLLANRTWKALLAAYEPPPLEPAVAEEIEAFVARRNEEGGAPTN